MFTLEILKKPFFRTFNSLSIFLSKSYAKHNIQIVRLF